MLFQQPPGAKYEYCNPCKYARSETAVDSYAKLVGWGANSDSDDTYEKLSPSMYSSSLPKVTSKPLSSQPATPVVDPIIPVKTLRSFDNNSMQTVKAIAKNVTTEPYPDRHKLIHETKAKERVSPTTPAPDNRQPPRSRTSDLIYEPFPDLGVKAADEPKQQNISKTTASPRSQHQLDPQYVAMHPIRSEPGKKPPTSTKPKSFKRNQVVASPSSADTDNSPTTAVCRVNPVTPFANTDMPVSSQSPTSAHGKKYWNSARDVPADLENLSMDQVRECMELLHLPKLAAAFKSQDVDGKLLVSVVSEEVLITDFNCRVFDAKKIVEFVKNGWRPNE